MKHQRRLWQRDCPKLLLAGSMTVLVGCAAQYDAAEQANIDQLLREDTPSLESLLQEQDAVIAARQSQELPELDTPDIPLPDELSGGDQSVTAVSEAISHYRAILELSPDDDELRFETQRRLADLQIEASELDPQLETRGTVSQLEAVGLYNGLLDARPNAANNDRILYQLSRAYQNLGQIPNAVDTLAELIRDFPGSRLHTDSRFRRAELLFKTNRYAESGDEYKAVMEAPDAETFFEQAQYKYGWSLYKQDRYRESLDTFVQILDRELPVGAVENLEATLEVIPRAQRELVRDVLRVVSLAFAEIGGGPALTEFLAERPVRSYEPVLYANLAELFIDKERANDAALALYGLADRSPTHPLAPVYAARVVDIYDKAGFADQVIVAKSQYVDRYDLDQAFWADNSPENSPEAYNTLVSTLRELGEHWHSLARAGRGGSARADFLRAADYYARYVRNFPDAEDRTELRFNWADALFAAGELEPAAEQFRLISEQQADHPRAPDSAYSLVLTQEQLLRSAAQEERVARLDSMVAAAKDLQARFPEHPQTAQVLTRSAEDLFGAKRKDEALELATQILAFDPPVSTELRLSNWRMVAYAHYDNSRYADAEQAFASWLNELPADAPQRATLQEAQATSIYRQAEAARDSGDLMLAAEQFARVKTAWPGSALAADADYDAAAAYLQAKDWPLAIEALRTFRDNYPEHRLNLEATRRLAAAYLENGDNILAANELTRLSNANKLAVTVRRDALWQATTLYDENDAVALAKKSYADYLARFGADNALRQFKALERLLALSGPGDPDRAQWLQAVIRVARGAGSQANDNLRVLAANSSLELAEGYRASYAAKNLSHPLERSLSGKTRAMDKALGAYREVLEYGFIDSSTQATFRIGELYFELSRQLLALPPPAGLNALEAEQYTLLLEEQAFPLEERAAEAHEINAARIGEGLINDWVRRSLSQLALILPARYGKTELVEEAYDELR